MKRSTLALISPLFLVTVLQTGGCLRQEVPPPPPGGTYVSLSAGANFEQEVFLTGDNVEAGANIASFTLRGSHRPAHQPSTIFIAAAEQGIVVSRDDGLNWEQITTPLTTTLDVALLDNGTLVATGTGPEGQGFVIRSLNDGLSWQTVLTVPVPIDTGPFQIIGNRDIVASVILAIETDPFDGNRLYAGTNLGTVLVGEESAKVWRTIHTLTPARFNPSQTGSRAGIIKVVPSPHTRGELLITTIQNELWRVSQGQQSQIEIPVEQTPEAAKFFISPGNHEVFGVTFAVTDPDMLLAGVARGLVISRDAGRTWRELALPVDAVVQFNSINVAISHTNSNRFLIAINNVVYRSEDSGNTWNTFSLGLPAHVITDLLISPANAARVLAITNPVNT